MESCSNKRTLLGTTVVTTCNALSNFLMGVHTQVENSFVKSTIHTSHYHVQLATLHQRIHVLLTMAWPPICALQLFQILILSDHPSFLRDVPTEVENSFVQSTIRISRYHVQLATLNHRIRVLPTLA